LLPLLIVDGRKSEGEVSVSPVQKHGCLKDTERVVTKNDVQKEVSFSPDVLTQKKKSYAEVTRNGMDEKHPLISFYPKVKK
jgi:hypothetical protein